MTPKLAFFATPRATRSALRASSGTTSGMVDASDLTVIEHQRQQDDDSRLCINWERRLPR
ncbi:hypothetical protein [Jannaschia donghaensis]|uniref:Uncharacterized protein n=1 Tax=Jannaschia donghaensis TaxID=420998 RepID=A0A0M6YD54_9RHOB|nr:hypothetical protein [Jannaschia donghaensis]CTQ48291.1 hypothetical protein JDO7802_00293 [Jannaschia donghaensis]